MAEDMDVVDMSFSDVMDVDISMADTDISRLLNGTILMPPVGLPTPKKYMYAGGDALPERTARKQLDSTFNLDDETCDRLEPVVANGNKPPLASSVTNELENTKNDLNATYVAGGESGNGNLHHFNGDAESLLEADMTLITLDAGVAEEPEVELEEVGEVQDVTVVIDKQEEVETVVDTQQDDNKSEVEDDQDVFVDALPPEVLLDLTVCKVDTPKRTRSLLDSTLGQDSATPTSLQRQQEQLLLPQPVMLQAVNRTIEKVAIAKEDGGLPLESQTMARAIENKENIAAGERRPRPSLLQQFDPLNSLNSTPKRELTQSPAKLNRSTEASPKVVGLLLDEEDAAIKRIMDAANEEKMHLLQEVNRLKLELNQVQQENTTLTLEIQKKEEVYLKAEANTQIQVDQYKQEIKQLLDQLEAAKETNNNEELLTKLKQELKQREIENNKYIDEIAHYKKIMNEYESTLSATNCENENLKAEHMTVNQHLSTLELSFSDTITKYERSKEVIAGYSRNEKVLQEKLEKSNQIAIKYEERYETLKSHANSQLDKANKDLIMARDAHKAEMAKLNTMIKRMEINNASLQHSLEQKVAECTALAQLCDEMTGSAPMN